MQPTRAMMLFASPWLLTIWFASFALLLAVPLTWLMFDVIGPQPGLVVVVIATGACLGVLLAIPIAWIVLGPIYYVRIRCNGGPFKVADRVEVLAGRHRGRHGYTMPVPKAHPWRIDVYFTDKEPCKVRLAAWCVLNRNAELLLCPRCERLVEAPSSKCPCCEVVFSMGTDRKFYFNSDSLKQTLIQFGITQPGTLFQELFDAYHEPHRHYHTADHIEHCLYLLDASGIRKKKRRSELALAIWFHDAVYDPQRSDNEEQSAAWARRHLEAHDVDDKVIARVCNLIMITKSHKDPQTPDEALMIDIDLAILGQYEEVFRAYDEAIGKEYAWVDTQAYRAGRKRVLLAFLNRDRPIYQTHFYQTILETSAKQNITRAIEELDAAERADGSD